ncbi:MAG: glycosyltransferase [Bacteroidota bacterium]|nr:glycosyltransferase [Bacteroidota bacterium]
MNYAQNTGETLKKTPAILVAVTTDVVSDMRVRKVCSYLEAEIGHVKAIGRITPSTFNTHLTFSITLFRLLFNRGPLFYAEYNLRLFLYGLFHRFDLIVSNDLDTLLACFLLSKIKRIPIVYDSHEYFTESVGLEGRSFQKNIWTFIEMLIVPRLKHCYTVSPTIARIYTEKYDVPFALVRNFPDAGIRFQKIETGFPPDKKILLYQGVFNPGRNLEAVIEAMQYVDDILFVLIGYGELEPLLRELTVKFNVTEKVKFLGKMPYEKMMQYTHYADLGIGLEFPLSESFKYSLPNKVFDYSLARLPFITLATPEVETILQEFEIGIKVSFSNASELAHIIKESIHDNDLLAEIRQNQRKASQVYTWDNECKELRKIYAGLR